MDDAPADAELTRLADGTLSDVRAAALRVQVGRDPERRSRLREQDRGVALVRATAEIVAPASLHAAIHGRTARRPAARGRDGDRRRSSLLVPLGAAVAGAIAVVVSLPGGSGSPTVTATARAAALASPVRAAPATDRGDPDLLSLDVGSIRFPAYERQPSERATGTRTDRLHGRRVQTVFYVIAGQQVGYSIVAGAALPTPRGPTDAVRGVRYTSTAVGHVRLITWRRAGHTCIIAARNMSRGTLISLAAATQAT